MENKLGESYVEFVAKGLEKVEAGSKQLTTHAKTAHEAVLNLSTRFEKLYTTTMTKGVKTTGDLLGAQGKLDQLYRNSGVAKLIEQEKLAEGRTAAMSKQIQVSTQKMLAKNKEVVALTAEEKRLEAQSAHIATGLDLQARKLSLVTGATMKLAKERAALEKETRKVEAAERRAMNIANLGPIAGRIQNIKEAMGPLSDRLTKVGNSLRNIGMAGAMAFAGISGAITGMAYSALNGTIEGERMSLAWERLSRVVGDMFTPYVRSLTTAVENLTKWWAGLSEGLKASIAKWALLAAGLAGLVAIFPMIAAAIAPLIGMIMALFTPIGLVIGGLVAMAVAVSGVGAAGISMRERLVRALTFVLNLKDAVVNTFSAVWDVISSVAESIWETMKSLFTYILTALGLSGKEGSNAAGKMESAFVTASVTIMDWWGKVQQAMAKGAHKIEEIWKAMGDTLAENLTWVGVQLGFVNQNVFEDMQKQHQRELDKMVAENQKALANMQADNKKIQDEIKARAAKNRNDAEKSIDELTKLFGGGPSGGGARLKLNVAFEGLQGTFDRLQTAFAKEAGQTIEQQQLGQLQQINQNMQQVAGGIGVIKDQIPAVI